MSSLLGKLECTILPFLISIGVLQFEIPGFVLGGHLAAFHGHDHLLLVGGGGLVVNLLGGHLEAVLVAVLLLDCACIACGGGGLAV